MLLRFSTSNFLSILDEQELSLVAGKGRKPEGALRFSFGALNVVPSAIIYGANAAGKSNIMTALSFMRHAVMKSHNQWEPNGGIPRRYFALNSDCQEKSSLFDIEFLIDGVRYHFGFEADNGQFVSEWLYYYPEGSRRKLYERSFEDVDFGATFKGEKKIFEKLMRKNSLFVSVAAQNGHDQALAVQKYMSSIEIRKTLSFESPSINMHFHEENIDKRVLEFLGRVGTGVVSYEKIPEEISDASLEIASSFAEFLKKHAGEKVNPGKILEVFSSRTKIRLGHSARDGDVKFFDMDWESAGTRRLLPLAAAAFQTLDSGGLLLIDEIDASLHTYAAEAFFALFDDPEQNRNGAQLIATAHDTNLLSSSFLKRDQVWLMEKNLAGESELFALAEIKSRSSDNFELGYLQGRYGATIPRPIKHRIASFDVEDNEA